MRTAAKTLLLSSVFLALAGVGCGGSDAPLVGGDRDAHGCIGSAGYTWCEAKQKCLRIWEEKCETASAELYAQLKNLTFTMGDGVVTMRDGVFEQELEPGAATKRVIRYFGNEAVGDLDGDGRPDAAFIITEDAGGSGLFYYVVAALWTVEGYKGTGAFLLGDRVAPQPTEIRDGRIIANFADRPAGAPMSDSPSVGTSKYLEVEDGKLVEAGR